MTSGDLVRPALLYTHRRAWSGELEFRLWPQRVVDRQVPEL